MQTPIEEIKEILKDISKKEPIVKENILKTNVEKLDNDDLKKIKSIDFISPNTVLIKRSGTGLSITVKLF